MFLIKKYLIILFVKLHLTISLRSSDFCILTQQECKGFYDEFQMYEKNCNIIKCHGDLSYQCGLKVIKKKINITFKKIKLNFFFLTILKDL